jgi:isoaspartyl peptidase/L-asparaginase-like protein (Ntn-hydrolase superfamily)
MDASIMDGRDISAGSVGMVTSIKNPRKVLPHANKIILSDEMKYHIDPSDEEIKAMISEVLSEIKSVRTKNGREFR